MFNDLPKDDVPQDKPVKKGLLQSLHSLTFSDDDDKNDDDTADVKNTPVVEVTNTVSAAPMSGPIGPSFSMAAPMNNSVPDLKNTPYDGSDDKTKPATTMNVPNPFIAPVKDVAPVDSMSLYDSKPVAPMPTPVVKIETPVKKVTTFDTNDLADATVTLDTIEDSLTQEMRKSMNSVKVSSENIKQKANYDLVSSFGLGAHEVLIFNTFLTKEMPYTSKAGKAGTQRVNFFGIMTELGVYSIRVSSSLTSKLEDAIKHTTEMRDDTVGLLGEGTSRRFVLKLPAEDYGSSNVLYVPLVGDLSKQNPESFTGLDAVEVDMTFIEDMMTLAIGEVDAMIDYEKRRRASLKSLQNKKDIEVKKASMISDKLSSLSL
jgi:hypothetical protein